MTPGPFAHVTTVPSSVLATLRRCRWPGDVRELENIIERRLIESALQRCSCRHA
jgi:transcriptional regulator with PAS, ATPase and Fis domain